MRAALCTVLVTAVGCFGEPPALPSDASSGTGTGSTPTSSSGGAEETSGSVAEGDTTASATNAGTSSSSGPGGVDSSSGSTGAVGGECDPLQQTCPATETCVFVGEMPGSFECLTAEGMEPAGTECTQKAECAVGLFCTSAAMQVSGCDVATAACCAAYCDTKGRDPVCMHPDAQCVAFFAAGEAPPGYQTVGYCDAV
jgi:hypothetical protein